VAGRSYCEELVRRDDPDRYLTALFAPPERRADLLSLYAFNAEVARSREAVSEPMLGHIRLQWWRDAIAECFEGRTREHQVVQPLAAAIVRRRLPHVLFDRLLDARAMDLTDGPPESLDQFVAYADASSGDLTRLALHILSSAPPDDILQRAGGLVGTAWALTGLMRAMPHQLRQGRCVLPRDVMERHGVVERDLRELRHSEVINRAVEEVCAMALEKLNQSRSLIRSGAGPALPALLPATLADAYLARLSRLDHDPFDSRNSQRIPLGVWRLMIRALTGRF